MDYWHKKMQPQAINEAEKQIEQFFISLDAERFSVKARKELKAKYAEIEGANLSAKKSIMKSYKRR